MAKNGKRHTGGKLTNAGTTLSNPNASRRAKRKAAIILVNHKNTHHK